MHPRGTKGGKVTSGVEKKPSSTSSTTKRFTATRLDKHEAVDAFSRSGKKKTTFSEVYSAGGIPCRIQHSATKMSISWDHDPSELSYDPLLLYVVEGLRETQHPYVFIAPQALEELLEAGGAAEKVIPLLPKVVGHIRMAMMAKEKSSFDNALRALGYVILSFYLSMGC
eukprot:TRINITY_DN39990_c0_g1_i1.p1 TRINITY_DN39990_c0_g1~~TRINITY_DN39990_c0_g1_i1.p1  ORF type:complete len:169 (-),score=38.41 TRINITY_DN39990_c0_g1_i1:11-517(-)